MMTAVSNDDKRISKIENRLTRLEVRVDRKHDEIAKMMVQIEEERKDIANLSSKISEAVAILENNNRDTYDSRAKLDALGDEVVNLKSMISTLKYALGVGLVVVGVVVPVLFELIK